MPDQRNLILAIAASVAIIFGFQFLMPSSKAPPPAGGATGGTAGGTAVSGATGGGTGGAPLVPGGSSTAPRPGGGTAGTGGGTGTAPVPGGGASPGVKPIPSRAAALAKSPRVKFVSKRVHGSINLVGGRVDDLTLIDYRKELDEKSGEIVLLSPRNSVDPYYAEFGWVTDNTSTGVAVPGPKTEWTASSGTLEAGGSVTLTWDNGQGIVFHRVYALDKNYMFTVTQKVENKSNKAVSLYPYGLIRRVNTPKTLGFYILHEGPIGVLDKKLTEIDYDDLKDDPPNQEVLRNVPGWLGITDKYWLVALIPDGTVDSARFLYDGKGGKDEYQVDYLGKARPVAAGATAEVTNRLFTGAKEVEVLTAYEEKLGIFDFDKAIDFGWFYWITKPLAYGLIKANTVLGNFGLAILLLTVLIKLAFFPLANKSYRAMSKMKLLQPQVTALRERFADDKQRLNKEMMELYKREKVNPTSGCLPMLIQIPVFFALYKVLFVSIEMRHAPFFGWIQDLSAPDPTSIWNVFGLLPFDPITVPVVGQYIGLGGILAIGVWPIIMGASMFVQQKLNPQPADPMQAKIFLMLPFVFTIMLARFPAGLVIYWAWNNILTIIQQWIIMKKAGVAHPTAS